jgi:hypothetical protein
MGDPGGDEHDGPGPHGAVLVSDADGRPSLDHVVDLVLPVRGLRIAGPRGKVVHPDAHPGDPEELEVRASGAISSPEHVLDLERVLAQSSGGTRGRR